MRVINKIMPDSKGARVAWMDRASGRHRIGGLFLGMTCCPWVGLTKSSFGVEAYICTPKQHSIYHGDKKIMDKITRYPSFIQPTIHPPPLESHHVLYSFLKQDYREELELNSTNKSSGLLAENYFDDEDDDDDDCSLENLEACFQNKTDSFSPTLKSVLSMPIVEVLLAVLVLLSSIFVGIDTLESIPPRLSSILSFGETAITTILIWEYVIRWQLNNFSLRYIVQPLAIIDLIAILPAMVKVVALMGIAVPPDILNDALVNLRLLRILRLQRVLVNYETFQKFEIALGRSPSDTQPYQLQLARVVISIFTLLSVTAGLIYSAEHEVNPNIPDYFTALYFSLTTLTTVGFGDIAPVTSAGRWIISGSILIGSVIVPAQAAALVEALLNRERDIDTKKSSPMKEIKSNSDDMMTNQILSRLELLEKKVDATNARIDRVLEALEEKAKNHRF
jgi:voltage-gated potassium channel